MRRWLVRIFVCLLLGAITTVAVAWGIGGAYNSIGEVLVTEGYSSFGKESSEVGWRVQVTRGWGRATVLSVRGAYMAADVVSEQLLKMAAAESVAPAWSAAGRRPPDGPPKMRTLERASGWPLLSLRGEITTTDGVSVTDSSTAVVISDEYWFRSRILPWHPVWPGFAIDTLFYAAIWGGVWFGFVGAKRGIRRRRGRCPMCGYDLRGNLTAGCSECGWRREENSA